MRRSRVLGQLIAIACCRLLLGYNQLSTLPAGLNQLTHLTVLSLSGNRLTTLPPVVFDLTWLKVPTSPIPVLPRCLPSRAY